MFDEAIFPYKILVDSSISSPYTQEQLVQCLNLSLSSSQPIISNSYLGGHNSNTQIPFDSLFTIMMFSLLTIFFHNHDVESSNIFVHNHDVHSFNSLVHNHDVQSSQSLIQSSNSELSPFSSNIPHYLLGEVIMVLHPLYVISSFTHPNPLFS